MRLDGHLVFNIHFLLEFLKGNFHLVMLCLNMRITYLCVALSFSLRRQDMLMNVYVCMDSHADVTFFH